MGMTRSSYRTTRSSYTRNALLVSNDALLVGAGAPPSGELREIRDAQPGPGAGRGGREGEGGEGMGGVVDEGREEDAVELRRDALHPHERVAHAALGDEV